LKNNLKKILLVFEKKEKKQVLLLLILMLVMAIMEMIGVASVVPFLAVLGNQTLIENNEYLAQIYNLLGFSDHQSFMIFLGSLAFGLLIFTALTRISIQYFLAKFSSMQIHAISMRLLKNYVKQPYSYFLKNNSSNMAKTMFTEVNDVVKQTLIPMLDFITHTMIVAVMSIVLVAINPKVALILLTFIGGFYGILHKTLVGYLNKIGKMRRKANGTRFRIASEIFGGIKDLKVLGRENVYLDAFAEPSINYARHHATAQILSQIPKFFIEVFIFGALLSMALNSLYKGAIDLGKTLPILGLYGMATIRLKPSIDRIYESISKMSFGTASLDNVLDDLRGAVPFFDVTDKSSNQILQLNDAICLKNISFTYPGANIPVLRNIDLDLKSKSCLGIIGATGSGKSTLVDIILGLHFPDNGKVIIDGELLTAKNVRSWQNNIGYVPQQIFLADDTISANIAFGVTAAELDSVAIERASQLAMLHDYVTSLPDGYNTKVGERGVRLSGGQRQRLGIARALYHNPDLLIFDEATSALDNETEALVMKAIEGLCGKKTIIMIAHRLSTLSMCNQIISLDKN
jgi:ABC-type multidrug transport system fused ATPase/permease subunit